MQLTPETRLSQALEDIPAALEYIVSLNPHDFNRLRNPVMRKYMSPRISLNRVAAIAGISVETFLNELAAFADGGTVTVASSSETLLPSSPTSPPSWMPPDGEINSLHTVDVIQIDDVAGDPLPPINAGIKRLPPGGVLRIKHRWEPQPLYDVWIKMGLEWFARPSGTDEWDVFVYRPATVHQPAQQVTSVVDLLALPDPERGPRLAAMFEQLEPYEGMEVWLNSSAETEMIRTALDRSHAGEFTLEEREPRKDGIVIWVQRAN